ncbi:MAG: tetratricopeptide repeat protein [Bacteroidota bacterium]
MKKTSTTIGLLLTVLAVLYLSSCGNKGKDADTVIIYPVPGTLFPADMAPPTFRWESSGEEKWEIQIKDSDGSVLTRASSSIASWKPGQETWEILKSRGKETELLFLLNGKTLTSFCCSKDNVGAPVFFRTVPLPFKFARENLKKINWHLGSVSSAEKAPVVLGNIPVCGNCHSFSADGHYLAMDVDARDEKGAYVIAPLEERTMLNQNRLINWSEAQNGNFTYGLLSQISPDGRYVVSTLKDCEIFVDRNNLEYSQLFFPFKGILQVYDRDEERYFELQGANDTSYVHSNPVWSPDGRYIYFTRCRAAHYEESGILHGSTPTNHKVYNKFLNSCLDRKRLFKFDIYRIPFNGGRGGKTEPVAGASHNGMSNYFPKISPDGKWMVFCQAESFMLLQKDSRLKIIPAGGGEARELDCNTGNMNSWHSWSPNSRWLVFSSKAGTPFTRLFLTHIDQDGRDSPAILLENMSYENRAVNIPEFVNMDPGSKLEILPAFLDQDAFLLRRGQIRNRKGDLEGAMKAFNQVLEMDQDNAEAWHGRGEVMVRMGMIPEALNNYDRAIELHPLVPDYFLSRGIARGRIMDYEGAFSDFDRAIELDPMSFMAYNDRGVLGVRRGKVQEALRDYDLSIELNPGAAMTYVNRGAARAMDGNLQGALSDFEKAISLNPDLPLAYVSRGMLREQQGDPDRALEDMDRALSIEPSHPMALKHKNRLLALKQGL